MTTRPRPVLLLAALASALLPTLLAACAKPPLASAPTAERQSIAARLTQDIATLASDEFAGRKPGTPGGQRTVDYLTKRFAEVGLTSGTNDPGNPWRAPVALTSVRFDSGRIEIMVEDRTIALTDDEALAGTTRQRELIAESEMVFVGYEAESVPIESVRGKVAVMLADRSLNPERRILLESKQASAVLIITDDADIVRGIRADSSQDRIALTGEFEEVFFAIATHAAMARALGEERWSDLVAAANRGAFAPVALNATANIEASSVRRDFTSFNVVGRLEGTRPDTKAVLLMAHWDHLGLCAPAGVADRICNGANDNASGVAVMLELAQRLADSGPFERDIYVVATTAEESGLLGAQAFVANPPLPLTSVVAAFNFDTVALAESGAPVGFVGEGRTPLDPIILETLLAAERALGSREYAESFLRRQDAWVLLQKGVPAVMLSSARGSEITAGPYFESDYHSPSDDMDTIRLGGAIDDLLLHEALVKRLAIPVLSQ
ncbi:MAG: M20/M25/M40 family metallo-hydrolase [Pseudomonadota bacterium]